VDVILGILTASLNIFRETALYILFGFLVAGLLRVYLKPSSVAHYFRRGRIRSVVNASLLGIPIPL
jgi:uncharacterized protein